MTSATERLGRELEARARAGRRLVEEVEHAPAAQRGDLLDLALGDLGERLRAVEDALDAGAVEILDREQVPHACASWRLVMVTSSVAVELGDVHVDALGAVGREVLADVVGADRQLAVAAVGQHGELDARRAAVVEQRLDRGAHGAAGVEHVVDEHDRVVLEPERQVAGADLGRLARVEVVAVEGDVDVAGGELGLQQIGDEPVQAVGEMRARGGGCRPGRPARRGSSRRSRARSARACAVTSSSSRTTLGCVIGSFLASPGRVKGTR